MEPTGSPAELVPSPRTWTVLVAAKSDAKVEVNGRFGDAANCVSTPEDATERGSWAEVAPRPAT